MLVFGIYKHPYKSDPAAGLPDKISASRPWLSWRVSQAFVLAANAEEQRRANEDKDLYRLNNYLEHPRLRDAFKTAALVEILQLRYGQGAAARKGDTVHATQDEAHERHILELEDAIATHSSHITTKVGGVFTARDAAKKESSTVWAYKLGGGRVA